MKFDGHDKEILPKMSAFFKRSEEEVRNTELFIDGVLLNCVKSFDTDTCDVEVFVRTGDGTPIPNPATGDLMTAVIHANEIRVVGKRGWSETYKRATAFVFTGGL